MLHHVNAFTEAGSTLSQAFEPVVVALGKMAGRIVSILACIKDAVCSAVEWIGVAAKSHPIAFAVLTVGAIGFTVTVALIPVFCNRKTQSEGEAGNPPDLNPDGPLEPELPDLVPNPSNGDFDEGQKKLLAKQLAQEALKRREAAGFILS